MSIWGDVGTLPDGRLAKIESAINGRVQAFIEDVLVWETRVEPTDIVRFLRIGISPASDIVGIGQGGEGAAWFVTNGNYSTPAMAFGQDPCALTHNGATFDIYSATFGTTYVKNGVTHEWPNTTQGFREVFPNGAIHRGDDYLLPKNFNGHTLWRRTEKLGWVVGQLQDGLAMLRVGDGYYFELPKRQMQESSHFTLTPDRIVICATTERGFETWEYNLADLPPATVPKPVEQPPVVVVPPKPDPPVEVLPIMPNIPNRQDIVERVRATYPTPLGATHGSFLIALAALVEHETGIDCGLQRKDGGTFVVLPDGTKVAQDILNFKFGNDVWGNDVLQDGEGEAKASWGDPGPATLDGFYNVVAAEPEGPKEPPVVVVPPVKPPVEPKPEETPEALVILRETLARVNAIEQDVQDLLERPTSPTAIQKFPNYRGTVSNRIIGATTVTLTPQDE